MNRRNGNGSELELKLNLSQPQQRGNNRRVESSPIPSPTSQPSSCVSSDEAYSSSSPETTSMILVGCPRCLMYVMLAEEDPRCPKCKSTVLLDVLHHDTTTAPAAAKKSNKS